MCFRSALSLSFHGLLFTLIPGIIFISLLSTYTTPPAHDTSNTTFVAPAECFNPPPDSCSFYFDCLESRYHCGPSGYPIGYGQKYCEKFVSSRNELSARGQVWMLATMHCLQMALVPEATANQGTTCSQLEDRAFGTHARCYLESGVCDLPPSDWEAILDIVNIETLFQSWDAFKATVQAATGCVEFYAFLVERKLV